MANKYNPQSRAFSIQANKQSYDEIASGFFNTTTLPNVSDPVFKKILARVTDYIFRHYGYEQRYQNLGTSSGQGEYSGIIAEMYMKQRKGTNYPVDNGTTPKQLGAYDWIGEDIDQRFHLAQFRWKYGYTISTEMLKRFLNSAPNVGAFTELQVTGASASRNMYIDGMKKAVLNDFITNVATEYLIGDIDISDFKTLTQEDAKEWLNNIDILIETLYRGSLDFTGSGNIAQVNKDDLQLIIPFQYLNNVFRRAYPETYHTEEFKNILPSNIVTIGQFSENFVDDTGAPVTPKFQEDGLNLTAYQNTYEVAPEFDDVHCILMHKKCIGFEEIKQVTMTAPTDVDYIATPVRNHCWYNAMYTDLLPSVKITRG